MSTPTDMAGWPDDPFALLGVKRGDTDTDIKRAYMRMIRVYKPEHHPDEFRRIRAAYETCVEQSKWFRPSTDEVPDEPVAPPPPPSPPRPPRRPAAVDAESESTPDAEPDVVVPSPARSERPVDPVAEAWNRMVAGDEVEAYARLVEVHDRGQSAGDVLLRLYWLLRLSPDLDPHRTRHHWLTLALKRSLLRGPALELYRRELETDPEGALHGPFDHGPYDALLAVNAAANDLAMLARWRIDAAGRLGWAGRIREDLTVLQRSLPLADDRAWFSLLVAANDWTIWGDHIEMENFIADEVAQLKHLQLRDGELFDRLEMSAGVARSVRLTRAFGLPEELATLARSAWAKADGASTAEVEAAAVAIERMTWTRALQRFDDLGADGVWLLRLVAEPFQTYLRRYDSLGDPEFPADEIRGIAALLPVRKAMSYQSIRPRIFRLLIDHCISPNEFAEACTFYPDEMMRAYAAAVSEDVALQAVWLAARIRGN